jgi:alpha,alpha-trehalose phosphorylase
MSLLTDAREATLQKDNTHMNTEQTIEPWYALGDPWVLNQTAWDDRQNTYFETIFTQSNGYLGVRGYTEEVNTGITSIREGYLAGVFGHVDEAAMKILSITYPWPSLQMLTLPELFACDITLSGETFTLSEGRVEFFSRTLDMRNGVLSRHIRWVSPKGRQTRIEFERFLSAAIPSLAMQRITITPENWTGSATLRFRLDADIPSFFRCGDRALPHLPQALMEFPRLDSGRRGAPNLTVSIRGTNTLVSMASDVSTTGRVALSNLPDALEQVVELVLNVGHSTPVVHSVAVVSSRDNVEADHVPKLAAELARDAIRFGYDSGLMDSSAVWERRWASSDITIDGPARDQAYIRFSAFSMLQMAPFHTDTMSIPARAYAYNRYHGLYYWDSETFLLPNYLHTHPEVAEHLLRFRYRTLDGARRTARRLNSAGACFPWMTDSDDGTEQAPWSIGDYVWHQNADIAYAIDQYVAATGDRAFMVNGGLELLLETARFWMSRVEEDADGIVHLHDTVGPDELDKHGRDNGYTSLMVRNHFHLAARWLSSMRTDYPSETAALTQKLEVSQSEVASWLRAADRLAVPNVPGHDFPLQDEFLLAKEPLCFDGMTADEAFAKRHTHRVVKQADIILAMYLLQDQFTTEQMRDAYDFYEPMCLHYSSLSYNTHSIIATKIGREAQAYDYFMKAAGLDLDNLRDATKDGLHAAALGGTWQTIVYGFLNMKINGATISFEPHLPELWKRISLHLMFRGYRLNLTISHHAHQLTVDGADVIDPAAVAINGVAHFLADGLAFEVAPQAVR